MCRLERLGFLEKVFKFLGFSVQIPDKELKLGKKYPIQHSPYHIIFYKLYQDALILV